MKRLSLLLALAPLVAFAAEPKREPVETVEQAREAAKLVVVAAAKSPLPDEETQPEAYGKACWELAPAPAITLTVTEWRTKWDIFADALVTKAREQGLDHDSLSRCLKALKHGALIRTHPIRIESPLTIEQLPDGSLSADKTGGVSIEISGFPAGHIHTLPASVPTRAISARDANESYWLIIAVWEYEDAEAIVMDPFGSKPVRKADHGVGLGHVRCWKMKASNADILSYTSCD